MPLYPAASNAITGLPTGSYVLTCSPNNTGAGGLTNGICRAHPWIVRRSVTLVRIGVEITTAGEAGSLVRLGVYADNGSAYPGALLFDAGTVSGATVAFPEITISQTLSPGIYWVAAANQSAPTTQPQVRQNSTQWTPPIDMTSGTAAPTAGQQIVGYFQTATGALPSTFSATVQPTSAVARVFVKTT